MMPSEPSNDVQAAGHELDRADGRSLLWPVVGLAMLISVSLVATSFLLSWAVRGSRQIDTPRSIVDSRSMPSDGPALQPSIRNDRKDQDDLREMRQAENGVFERLGWEIDPKTGRETVPASVIERLARDAGSRSVVGMPALSPATHSSTAVQKPSTAPTSLLDGVGVDQRLGESLPLDTTFRDESDGPILLRDYFHADRPVIMTFIEFDCPRLCALTLNQLTRGLNALSGSAGETFDVVAISIDPNESAAQAAAKKQSQLKAYRHPSAEAGWHFLTGDAASIDAVAKAAGLRFRRDERGVPLAQAGCTAIITPDGRVSSYFLGVDFPPVELQQSLHLAAAGQIASATDSTLFYCLPTDRADAAVAPRTREIITVLRAMAAAAAVGIVALIVGLQVKGTRQMQRAQIGGGG